MSRRAPGRRPVPRKDREPMSRVLTRGLLMLAGLIALTTLAVKAQDGVPGKSYDYVEASLPEVGNLISHDPVRIAGKRVGQVADVGTGEDGNAIVRLQLESGTDLPSDSQVLLRANGLLGARYVELVPGRRAPLRDGELLRGDENALTYGVTEALDVFDRQTRGALGSLLGEAGTGMLGNGRELNDALRLGGDAIVPFRRLMRRLEAQPGALQALLPSMTSALRPLDEHRRELFAGAGAAADALGPFARRGDDVRATLAEAPGTLAAANAGLGQGTALLAAARAVATQANATLDRAPGALRATAALLDESPRPLRRTRGLLQEAGPAVPAALRLTKAADPLLRPLREAFSDLTPMSRQIARYECDIRNFGAVFRSMTGLGGFGEGPNGPAMGFRLQAVAIPPTEMLSVKDSSGLLKREGYPEPCKYLAKPYPTIRPAGLGGGR
ncbi:MAG TPA: MlaD family protein [Baekduia sp.]|nr:MlaD family protein [Baekduia sp.]